MDYFPNYFERIAGVLMVGRGFQGVESGRNRRSKRRLNHFIFGLKKEQKTIISKVSQRRARIHILPTESHLSYLKHT